MYGPLLLPSKFGGAGTLHIAGVGDKKFNVLSHFGITEFVNIEMLFMFLNKGRFVVVHPHPTFSLQHWASPLQNDEIEHTVSIKTWVLACHI